MSTAQQPGPGLTLQEWLELTGTSYSAFSRQIPCSVAYPRMLALGLARPSYEMAVRIEQLTRGEVPRTNWYPSSDEPQQSTKDLDI